MSKIENNINKEEQLSYLGLPNFVLPKINIDSLIEYNADEEINQYNLEQYRIFLATINGPLNFLIQLVEKNIQVIKFHNTKSINKINLKIEKLNSEEIKKLQSIFLTNDLSNKNLTELIKNKIEELSLEYEIINKPEITKLITSEKEYQLIDIQILLNYHKKIYKAA